MAASLLLTLNEGAGRSATDLSGLVQISSEPQAEINNLIDYLSYYVSGAGAGSLTVSLSSAALVSATGTVTAATVLAGDTVTINGVVFTATGSVAPANYFNIGASNTTCAAALATSINASTSALIQGMVTASSALAVCTITALPAGKVGNAYTLASSGATLAVSGSRLTGGAGGLGTSTTSYDYGV